MSTYTIKDLEALSGIKAHTIRMWEKRYDLLKPNRTETNIRYYSDAELKRLLTISLLVKHGFKISKVALFDDKRLAEEVLRINATSTEVEDLLEQLLISMLDFNIDKFESILDEQSNKIGFEETMLRIVFPFFEKIGIYWQIGSVFPAQEHLVSNLVRERILMNSKNIKTSSSKKAILFYLPENEMHELGILFYNYIAKKEGLNTIYLGANVPMEDLQGLANLTFIDFVCTAFINAADKDKMESYFKELSLIFKGKSILVSGEQVIQNKPKLPSSFNIVYDVSTFRKYIMK